MVNGRTNPTDQSPVATARARLTVAIPTFNRADFIEETLSSLATSDAELPGAIRIVVIDDGSEDETEEIVATVQQRVAACRIDYHYQETSGEAAAVNLAWSLADSDYFAVVGSDDPVLPNWAERMVAFLDSHPEIIVAYPDWYLIGTNSERRHINKSLDYAPERLIAWASCLPGPGAVIRRAALHDIETLHDPRYGCVADYKTWLDLALMGPFGHVPEVLACRREHPAGATVSGDPLEFGTELVAMMRAYFARPDLPPDIARMRRSALSRACYHAAVIARPKYPGAFLRFLAMSYAYAPGNPRGLPKELRRNGLRRVVRSVGRRARGALHGMARRVKRWPGRDGRR